MVTKTGLRLVIELSPEEADAFRHIAQTDDQDFYDGIAKALVLRATGTIVDPRRVVEEISLIRQLSEYAIRGDLPTKQEWADELSFTRQQLELESVRSTIYGWASFFSNDITRLMSVRNDDYTDQIAWVGVSVRTTALLEILKESIREVL